MPDLRAKAHDHLLMALMRLNTESLDVPLGDTGYILMEDGDQLLTEDGDMLKHDGSVRLRLTYKLRAQEHDYVLTAKQRHSTKIEWEISIVDGVAVGESVTITEV